MSFSVRGENLELMWYRKALWILLAHENPIEIECRAKETQHGPYESVMEKENDGEGTKSRIL